MFRHGFIGFLLALIMSAPAAAAGLKLLTVPADASGPAITVAVWYPSADKPSPVAFGPFTALAAQDGKINGHGLPLVVLSHGRGGSFVVHHDTAEHLADAGFVVAALNHPGDTARDKSLFYDLSIYVQRPLDVKRVIDYLTGAAPLATTIDPNRIGVYGYSRGGYTALVAIGAKPDFALGLPTCERQTVKVCGSDSGTRVSQGAIDARSPDQGCGGG
jgi:predicted dienelactone hydrolase